MLWPIRQATAPSIRRIGSFASSFSTAHLPFERGFQIYPLCRMSSTTSRSKELHQREKDIYQSVASQLRKKVQEIHESGDGTIKTYEQRTAADPRQNTIHDVRLSSILELYDNIRLLRLQVISPSTTTPEEDHEHPNHINASPTSIVI